MRKYLYMDTKRNSSKLTAQLSRLLGIFQDLLVDYEFGNNGLHLCTTHGTMYPVDFTSSLTGKLSAEEWHLCYCTYLGYPLSIPEELQKLGYKIERKVDILDSTQNSEGEGYAIVVEEYYLIRCEAA